MKLKYLIASFLVLCAVSAKGADGDLFPYPTPPEDSADLTERCDYLVEHFWDQCNLKSAMSHREKLENCFSDWLQFMPYARKDVVFPAIDSFTGAVAKSGEQTLLVGQWAEYYLYSDSANFISSDLYLPFAKAVIACKKVKSADKARFQAQVQIIEHSTVGRTIPSVAVEDRFGNSAALTDLLRSDNTLLFFNDPDCLDCRLARTRLMADYNLKSLLEKGVVQMISIYPGEVEPEWLDDAKAYPDSWTVVAAPEIDLYFDLRDTPRFYIVNVQGVVTAAEVPLENLMNAFRILMQQE